MTHSISHPMRRNRLPALAIFLLCGLGLSSQGSRGEDWPQWRGSNRDARVTGFTAPKTWPKELTKKWKVAVGNGVSTPSLVGDKLYVFTREDPNEIVRCLDAATGKQIWDYKYAAKGATGAASSFPGPRSSPTVTDGKVVTLGVQGKLACLDAASGKEIWSKDDSNISHPRFFTSSSPVVSDGLCITQFGGEGKGGMVAYDLGTGAEKWKWTGAGTAYASPVMLTIDGTKAVVAETDKSIVAIGAADGKDLWQTPYVAAKMNYNSSTPIVDGTTIVYSGGGRGTKAVKIEKNGAAFAAKDLWNNAENSVKFNTPVVKDGLVYGLTVNNSLFCIDAKTGKTAWTAAIKGKGGYGSIVDAGPVLFSLTPSSQLIVFKPGAKELDEVASYKVADSETYAYPVISGNRIYVKDKDSVTLWTIE